MILGEPILTAYSLFHFARLLENSPGPEPVQSSVLSVSTLTVSAAEPATITSIPGGSSQVPVLSFEVEADCAGDVNLYGFSLEHEGLGRVADVSGVYAFINNQRVSRLRPFNSSDGLVYIALRDVVVKACNNATVVIYADFTADNSPVSEHRFRLVKNSLESSATVTRQTPVHAVRMIRYSPRSRQATIDASVRTIARGLSIGQRRPFATITLAAGDDIAYVGSMTITNTGTIRPGDLADLYLEASGQPITPVISYFDGDQITFTLTEPLRISRGRERYVTLYGRVAAGTGRSVRFEIEQPSDVVLVDGPSR